MYDFKDQNGEVMGTGAMRKHENDGIDIVSAGYESRENLAANLSEYQETGKVHTLTESIGSSIAGRGVAEDNKLDGRTTAALEIGSIENGKLAINQYDATVSTTPNLGGILGSGGGNSDRSPAQIKVATASP